MRPLTPDADSLAALCARSLPDAPSADELRRVLLDDPATTLHGDPRVGVLALASRNGVGHLRLLVVDPAHRRRGIATSLIADALDRWRSIGCARAQVGADAPRYLWPGVDAADAATLAVLERAGFTRGEALLDLEVDLDVLPDPPPVHLVDPSAEAVAAWCARHWPHWADEFAVAHALGGLTATADEHGLLALCAAGVNRDGWIGPVAVRPRAIGRGSGRPVLLAALHRLRAAGHRRAEIAWVGPLRPYLAIGARPGRTFLVHHRDL